MNDIRLMNNFELVMIRYLDNFIALSVTKITDANKNEIFVLEKEYLTKNIFAWITPSFYLILPKF